MNKALLALLLLLSAPARAEDADAAYLALVDAATAKPAEAKWCEIRNLYPSTSFYRALGDPTRATPAPEMGKRMLMEKDRASVDAFRIFQREHFGSVNAHRYAAYLYKWHMELAKEKLEKVLPDFGKGIDYIDFKLEKQASRELLNCFVATGDGKSMATAWSTISMEEQQILIEQYFHVDATAGTMKRDGGKVYSIIDVQIPDGPKVQVHFRLDDRMVEAIKRAQEKK